jgi:carboxyl-terminal processing protease
MTAPDPSSHTPNDPRPDGPIEPEPAHPASEPVHPGPQPPPGWVTPVAAGAGSTPGVPDGSPPIEPVGPGAPPLAPSVGTPGSPAAGAPIPSGAQPLAPTPAPAPPVPPRTSDRTVAIVAVALAVVAILAGAALFLSGYSLGRQTATTPGTASDEQALFQPFWDTYRAVTERYAGGDVDRKALVEGAIKGMVEALGDPYSSYLTPEEYKASLQGIEGEFEGIGAEIGTVGADGSAKDCTTLTSDCRLGIVQPIAGSPAERAGLQAGDVVIAVDGESLDGSTLDQARDRIRGPKGSTVTLTIVRDGGEPLDLSVVRDVIQQKEVVSHDLADGTVAWIAVTGFSSDAAADLHTALKAALDKGERQVILDLRSDPGGFVDAAVDIASEFVGSGPIYWQEDSKGNQVATDAKPGGLATDPSIQLIVLIDGGSASASEIVAGAIQDTGRGRLVGQQSFGKGTVQQWSVLEGDNGGFRLTIAKWLTPDKRWIHHTGLTPDVVVDVPDDTPSSQDPILDKALELFGHPAPTPSAAPTGEPSPSP